MILEYLKALSLIFVAEMGDKTQILAMTFAMQYPVGSILAGVGLGAFFNHGIAIALGALLMSLIPMGMMQVLAGGLFVFFAFKSLSLEDEEDEESQTRKYGPILTVALAFFIGELGDKTQLAALGLSTDAVYPWVILLGTTSGMMLTSLVGILVGRKLGRKIPEDKLKIGAFFIFMAFGVQKLYASYFVNVSWLFFTALVVALAVLGALSIARFRKAYAALPETAYAMKSQALKELMDMSRTATESLCRSCGKCDGSACKVGYMKAVLAGESDRVAQYDQLADKSFDRDKAREMLESIRLYDEAYGMDGEEDEVIVEIRNVMQEIA